MPEKIKILLVDDHKIFAKGVATLLESEHDLAVLGCVYDGESALAFIRKDRPDVLLTDIQMGQMSGIELTRQVKEEFPELKVIGLSMFDKPQIIHELLEAGAEGYLLKDIEKDELVSAIRDVWKGNMVYGGEVAKILFKSLENKDLLTRREKEIIALIAKEMTNTQIADKLFISEYTVESHRKNIFRKTKAKSIVGLINFAYENKLI